MNAAGGVPQLKLVLELTVPALMMLDESAMPGVLVSMDINISTGSVDQLWPKQSEHSKHTKNAQIKIFLISTPAMASALPKPLAALSV
jgi:hypothetical protein